jgi:tetratricopeptide (TPR) repeat protein
MDTHPLKHTKSRLLYASLTLLLSSGCATVPPPEPPAEPPPPARDRVAELRTVASGTRSAVEVAPLQNPAVELLIEAAASAEVAGDHSAALAQIEEALTVEPENPRLWQLKAEALLRQGEFLDAEKHAMKSYDLGSRIGEWCMRNWLLIAESRDALGDASTSEAARARAEGCPTKPLPRY